MGDTVTHPEPTHQQETVTTSASTMERILSDDNIPIKSQRTKPNPQNAQFPYPQYPIQNPYAQQPQYTTYINSNQPYTNIYGYQQPPVPVQQAVPTPQIAQNLQFQNATTQRQLQLQLEQQMQHLHLLQQAQQLERQRLDLAQQQRHLDAQAVSQHIHQNELVHRRQIQEQQEQKERAEKEAKERAVAQAQALKESQENQVETDEKYPVIFHWSHGGRVVYVAYSGDNWSHKYRMQRSHNDFSLIMEIIPGVYHYKFIVDNQWRCARNQKHVRDANGAYSNVLDVRSHSYQQVIDEKEKKRKREKKKAQYQYTQNLPKSDHYMQDPLVCPILLQNVILNGEDDEDDDDGLGNDEGAKKVKKKSNLNTMKLPKPLRVSLNHLYVSDKREEEVVTLGMTERYKDKFYTTVYYTPIRRFGDIENGE